jgi:hypothetical protein
MNNVVPVRLVKSGESPHIRLKWARNSSIFHPLCCLFRPPTEFDIIITTNSREMSVSLFTAGKCLSAFSLQNKTQLL